MLDRRYILQVDAKRQVSASRVSKFLIQSEFLSDPAHHDDLQFWIKFLVDSVRARKVLSVEMARRTEDNKQSVDTKQANIFRTNHIVALVIKS